MKTYNISWSVHYSLNMPAKSENDARDKWLKGKYDQDDVDTVDMPSFPPEPKIEEVETNK